VGGRAGTGNVTGYGAKPRRTRRAPNVTSPSPVTNQLDGRGVVVKTGTLIDATVIASASSKDQEARTLGGAPAQSARARLGNVRRRIEKIFGTWKRSYGLRRTRWLGLAKAALQVRLTATAYNLRRAIALVRAQAA
jgi:hypothetical protein